MTTGNGPMFLGAASIKSGSSVIFLIAPRQTSTISAGVSVGKTKPFEAGPQFAAMTS